MLNLKKRMVKFPECT